MKKILGLIAIGSLSVMLLSSAGLPVENLKVTKTHYESDPTEFVRQNGVVTSVNNFYKDGYIQPEDGGALIYFTYNSVSGSPKTVAIGTSASYYVVTTSRGLEAALIILE
ncbi:hypothetical protein H7F33_10330 [Pedobacter sp. PAMC26386]|nr:hypothetical protein H7F33_10330 [Pedobacter sp. PAMC26386]